MDNRRKKELERQKVGLERKLRRLRKELDRPVMTIGYKTMQSKIILYRNRIENNEYSFKLDAGVSVDYDPVRNLSTGEVQQLFCVHCGGKNMFSPQVSKFGYLPCKMFRKVFLKTRDEYIRHKDIIDREYVEFDKLENELKRIKDELEEDEIMKASNERLEKMRRYFGDIKKG